ncbi:MAG: hypothetical protein U0M60_06815 [Clostridia bacterium]|nr:hypothetical protein [Clostridia bacterium]
MNIEQYVMAYEVEHDRLRAILPDGFISLRPVLRINAEIIDSKSAYVEFNTAVEKGDFRGWLNIFCQNEIGFEKNGKLVLFKTDTLNICYTGVGIEGSCPAEKDNNGCCFIGDTEFIRPPEPITANKEFCDCEFKWNYTGGAFGKSLGKTLPAIPTDIKTVYPKEDFTLENAATIPCNQVLGAYTVAFKRAIRR